MAARREAPRAGIRPVTVTAPARRAGWPARGGTRWPSWPPSAPVTSGMPWCAWPSTRTALPRSRTRPGCGRPSGACTRGSSAGSPASPRPPRARRGGRVLLRAAALSGHRGGAGLAVLAQACGVRPAALGAGAGHDRRERGVLGLAGRPARRLQPGELYAAMPSLHVAWAAWCAAAIVITTRSRWRHLAWAYPAATALVVLASASHFLLDAAGGLAVTALGMLAASRPGRLAASRRAHPASPGHRHAPGTWAPAHAGFRGRPAGDRPAPGRTGCARRWRTLAAGHRMRGVAARRHTAIDCLAGFSARARCPAPARPRRERR